MGISNFGMPHWFVLTLLLLFRSCEGFHFNVTRVIHGDRRDLFTNMDPLGKCPRRNDNGRQWCLDRNGDCSSLGCCICSCTYSHSTFRMGTSPKTATCVENSSFRTFANCSQTFATILKSQPLLTLNLKAQGSKGMNGSLSDKCNITGAQYLKQNLWKDLGRKEKDTFYIRRIPKWPYTNLGWTGKMPSLYSGYIIKLSGECDKGPPVHTFCVLFKTKGNQSWTFPDPTTQAYPMTTSMSITTAKSSTATVLTTRAETTPQTKGTTKVTSAVKTTVKATRTAKAPYSKGKTTKAVSAKPPPETPKIIESSTDSSVTTKPPLKTQPATADAITVTPSKEYIPVSKEASKNKKALSDKDDEISMTMIAVISGVAAVGCLVLGFLCLWFIIVQRRKSRDLANYDAETTVIENPTTGTQNHFPIPGILRNSLSDENTYMEPVERTRKNVVRYIGDTSYDNDGEVLIKKNPGAKDSPPLNNIKMKPLNTPNRRIQRENTYDNRDQFTRGNRPDGEKPIYDNPEGTVNEEKPIYQSLIKDDARARFNSDLKAAVYQSLNPDGMMYQPLQKNTVQQWREDIPEYLALLNPHQSPRNLSPSPPEYQPPYSTGPPPEDAEESPEYADYADLDELEKIAAKEGSKKCPKEDPSYAAPLYNAPEGSSYDYACPTGGVVYDILEGPDSQSNGITNQGFEPPMYAVLEGPDTYPSNH
ncbi:uncharacterized protein [Porites lutea]|uniref:uncharacterized protein n=1 Tax=Porites lutea TaxID=51062 RepID=UPI003CC6B8CA